MKKLDLNKCDWMCVCGYRLTGLQYNSYKEDFGCPRCRKSFMVFSPVEPLIKDHIHNTMSKSKGTLNIYKETTLLLLSIKGFCITVYPFTQFQFDKGAKFFSIYKSKDIFELHLGLFGFIVTRHTKHRPNVSKSKN